MEELRIPQPLAEEMVAHCVEGRPHEACGLLAAKDGHVVKVFLMTNVASSPVRYALDAKEQFVVYQALDDHGWELGGVFHSHTRTEPYPSPTDVRMASEDVPYVIVSLASDPPVIKAWRIIKDRWDSEEGDIREVPVAVEG